MKMVIEENISNVVEVEKLETVIEIADFDVGLRQLLEAQQSRTLVATDNITLEDSDFTIQFIDPGGASRDVNLPAVSVNNHGFVIVNTAATGSGYVLTVKTGATTLGTIPPNSGIGWFFSNGLMWKRGGVGGFLNLIEDGSELLWNGDSAGQAYICQGRLTLESGVPVSTTDQVNKTILYFTPYNGNFIDLYTGTNWRRYKFEELKLAIGSLTASRPHDIFIYDDSGTLALQAVAWTNNTTRDTELATQDGVYVLSGATNKRYLGTIYMDSEQKCQDTTSKRFVWNLYNRIGKYLNADEGTSHTYNGAKRKWNNSDTNNLLEYVNGLRQYTLVRGRATIKAGADGNYARTYIWQDGTGAATIVINYNVQYISACDVVDIYPAAGYHYLQMYEAGNHASSTFYSMNLTIVWMN